jgi:hypothetical protein
MPLIAAGPAVWNEFGKFRRANKRTMAQAHEEWSLSSGWRVKPEDEWDKQPKKGKTKKVIVRGHLVEVPDADYEDYIGHMVSPPSDPDTEIGRYIDKAFYAENHSKLEYKSGKGHIAEFDYSTMYQLLRVFFENDGAVVIYFRVPLALFSELAALADSDQTIRDSKNRDRHVLGIRFWDIIRIRGTLHGSRYKFEYAQSGARIGSRFSQSVSGELKEAVTTGDTKAKSEGVEAMDLIANGFRNMLGESALKTYNGLKTYEDKASFLHKAGLL